jgi:hypothetical protein
MRIKLSAAGYGTAETLDVSGRGHATRSTSTEAPFARETRISAPTGRGIGVGLLAHSLLAILRVEAVRRRGA